MTRKFNLFTSPLDLASSRPGYRWRAARIGDLIGGEAIGATLYELEDGESTFPYHYHHGIEEWLYVVEGAPVVRTPDGELRMAPGQMICFAADRSGAHVIRGPGRVVIFSSNRAPSISVYPDSDKLGTRPADPADRLDFRRADAVEYWDGE